MSYDRYIPGISLSYDIDGHNPGIYQVYTTKFPSMGVPDGIIVKIKLVTVAAYNLFKWNL